MFCMCAENSVDILVAVEQWSYSIFCFSHRLPASRLEAHKEMGDDKIGTANSD